MQLNRCPLLLLLSVWGILSQSNLAADVLFDRDVPQVAFAARELSGAITESRRADLKVTIAIDSDPSNPEAFQVQVAGPNDIEITDGAVATYNLIEPVSVLWSSRIWDTDGQKFKLELRHKVDSQVPLSLSSRETSR
jgi:hypothetical protein